MTPGRLTRPQKSAGNNHDNKLQESVDNAATESGKRPATTGKQVGLTRSERVLFQDEESFESGDSVVYPSTAPETRRSEDVVVVDVHNENKGSEPNLRTRKLFKQRNNAENRNSKTQAFNRNETRIDFETGNAWGIQESIDTITAFEDANKIPDKLEINAKSPYRSETHSSRNDSDNSNSGESYRPQFFGSEEKIIGTSRENSVAEGETGNNPSMEEPKRRRKRWSKNQHNLQLTQELIANSSDTNQSVESEARSSTGRRVKPVPAPRRKGVSKSFAYESSLAFDNVAFRSDSEEVLRIETEVYEPQGTSDGSHNYRQSTKIEMTHFYDTSKKGEERENEILGLENKFTRAAEDGETRRLSKIEPLKASEFADTSDEVQTEVRRVKKREDSCVVLAPRKTRNQYELETTELSENDQVSEEQVLSSDAREKKSQKGKIPRKSRRSSRHESTSFDTGNSLTDISDLPRSKSRREFPRKSKSKMHRDSRSEEPVRKHKPKRSTKNDSENKSDARSSRDDLIEYNADRIEKFTSVTIHKADVLRTDFITRHPMVKVHIVDIKTGNYLETRDGDNYGRCSYLQPMITRKFDFKDNRSIVPNWEEELIFEYNFDEIIETLDKPILILFEILDLLNFAEASFKYNVLGNEGCWHKIAWAFLRPVGVSGTSHINKKLRLQLYEPSKTSKKSGKLARCEVFNWWRSTNREKYPSTLYVTLKSVDPPIQEPIVYERLSFNELLEIEDESRGSCKKSSDLLQLPKWTRLAAQSCKIPNNHLFQSETFENGSFYLTFSNDGKYLACVGSEEDNYPIVVYSIPEGKICVRFIGHANFVYSLNWSNDDKYLLSVSSDQTACIWDVGNRIIQQIQMLPHPSYVYCGKFYPGNKNVVVTGCYDCVARVWTKSKSSKRYELTQELDEHKGYVNSLCFQKDGGLITADSLGAIILWTLKKRSGIASGREWHVSKTIKINEIENIVVNTIVLHPLGSRLLVHSRDNSLRMIDLATGVVLQTYKGLRNRRLQTTACLSPCGGLVLCGGEDSYLTVWSLENGRRLAKYMIQDAKIVACVAYHPLDHILAFSTFGSVSAIQIMNFDKNSTGENVALNLAADNDVTDDADDFKIMMKFDKNDLAPGDNTNLKEKYSGRKNANVSHSGKKFEAKVGRSSRVDRTSPAKINKDAMNENSISRQESLRLKIQRLNESGEGLKSRSAARLNNIIEKIDRILVNTTLKRDLDLTCGSNETRKEDMAQVSSNSKRDTPKNNRDKIRSRSLKSRNRDKSSTSNTDATMELCNTSTEFIEMQNICSVDNETSENEDLINSNERHSRLRSRTSNTTNISLLSDIESNEERVIYKSSSESHRKSSYKENKINETNSDPDVELNCERKTRRKRRGKQLSGSSDKKLDNETCIIVLENTKYETHSNPSTPDSAGTYTVDKGQFPKPTASDKSGATDTSSSVRSSATFIIENEISSGSKSVKLK